MREGVNILRILFSKSGLRAASLSLLPNRACAVRDKHSRNEIITAHSSGGSGPRAALLGGREKPGLFQVTLVRARHEMLPNRSLDRRGLS